MGQEPKTKRVLMLDVTSAQADLWFDISNIVLVVGAIAVALGTLGAIQMSGVREHFADVRISENEAKTAQARADAEAAKERAAEANARAAEATLKLGELRERLKPRKLDYKSFQDELRGRPKAPVEILFPKDDAEAYNLAMQFRDFLRMAGWDVKEPAFFPPVDVERFKTAPSAMAAGGQPTGVALVVRAASQADFKLFGDPNADTPFNALQQAILASLGKVSSAVNSDASPEPGIIRIVVAPKPEIEP
jgi:hypothetical protein